MRYIDDVADQRRGKGDARACSGRALRMAALLLAFGMTQCGGKGVGGQPEGGRASFAGQGSGATSASSGSSTGGGAGQLFVPIDSGSLIDAGEVPAVRNCNALSEWGEFATSVFVVGDAPKPQGGTITDGTFRLTGREAFVARDSNSSGTRSQTSSTLVISASTGASADLQLVWMELSGELPHAVRESQSLVVSGTSYDYTITCPSQLASGGSSSLSFTATANELIWIRPVSDTVTYVETFTRQ
jgi:hypothetical protein